MKDLYVRSGVKEIPASPWEFGNQYPESNCLGNLPACGYYICHAKNVEFENCQVQVALPDARPIFVAEDADSVVKDGIYISSVL